MADLIRDTAFGHAIRLISSHKLLKYPEEADPSIWSRYVDEKRSGYLARHGKLEPPEDDVSSETPGGPRTPANTNPSSVPHSDSNSSSTTRVGDGGAPVNQASGVKVDQEKGRDAHLVTWYGPDDPGTHASDICHGQSTD